MRKLEQRIHAVQVFGKIPRAVGDAVVEAPEQIAVRHAGGSGEQAACKRVLAHGKRQQRIVEAAAILEIHGAGRGKVSFVRVVRSLLVLDAIQQFGNHEVDVGVALAVAVRVHVDGNAIDAGCEVSAVVEIEATQEILVRLAVAAVLGYDEARYRLQQFASAQYRTRFELRARDDALGGRFHRADELVPLRGDDDLVEIIGRNAGSE